LPIDVTTRDAVLEMLPIDGSDTTTHDTIDRLIAGVSASFETLLDRWTEETARTVVRDVEMDQSLFSFKGFPIASIASVKFSATRDFAGATAWDTDLYVAPIADPEDHVAWFESVGAIGRQVMQVTYTGGMGTNTAALVAAFPDIEHAAILEIVDLYQRRDALSFQQRATGADTIQSYPLKMLQPTLEMVARRKRDAYGLW